MKLLLIAKHNSLVNAYDDLTGKCGVYFHVTSKQYIPYSKKLWRFKSLAKRATASHWRKKLW